MAIPGDLSGWTGSARLTGPSQMSGTVVTEGADFHVTFSGQSATGTKTLAPGQYTLTVWATNGNDRYAVYQASLTVTPNLAIGQPAQSHAQRMLTLVETAIYNRVNGNTDGGIESYAIDGMTVNKLSVPQLEQLRAKYATEVSREQNNGAFGTVQFAFTPAGNAVDHRRRFS